MRKAFYVLILFFTYYLAAMYRCLPLMVLCGTEFLVFCLSFFLPRMVIGRLSVTFPKKSEAVQAGCAVTCAVHSEYKGRVPAGRLVIGIGAGYAAKEEEAVLEIPGECECGGNDLSFCLRSSECGLLRIRIKHVRVFDPFSLFSVQKQVSEEMQAAVFPPEYALRMNISVTNTEENACAGEQTICNPQQTCGEILQLREYRAGDSARHIHWNMSARTDGLWVREYGQESGRSVSLILEPDGFYTAETADLNAFYSLLYAMLRGFFKHVSEIFLFWFNAPAEKWEMTRMHDRKQCRQALLMLYQARECAADFDGPCIILPGKFSSDAQVFRLNMNLAWFLNQTLIHQFSARNLEQEIQNKTFVL